MSLVSPVLSTSQLLAANTDKDAAMQSDPNPSFLGKRNENERPEEQAQLTKEKPDVTQ